MARTFDTMAHPSYHKKVVAINALSEVAVLAVFGGDVAATEQLDAIVAALRYLDILKAHYLELELKHLKHGLRELIK